MGVCKLYFISIQTFSILHLLIAFNLDVHVPLVKDGPRNSYFGFSLDQHQIYNPTAATSEHVILVGAPRGNITSIHSAALQNIKRPGLVFKCPLTTDCTELEINRELPSTTEPIPDKTDQWLGVSVRSQGTPEGRAMACAHRYAEYGRGYRYGFGICVGITNVLDQEDYFFPCSGLPTKKGHQQYGFCQAGSSVDVSPDGDILIGAPGPLTWSGAAFKNIIQDSLDTDYEWFQSPSKLPNEDVEGPPVATNFYSYLGSSSIIGNVLDGRKTYVVGAPRSNDKGQVLLFQQGSKGLIIQPEHYLSGTQFGSRFGSDVALLDINNDGRQDIVVGAPFYTEAGVSGAIYVYLNGPEGITSSTEALEIKSRDMPVAECEDLDCENARFGTSVASPGDIDQDGYDDLVVGAPFEGDGVIYIFRGSDKGLRKEPSQRIAASDLKDVAGEMKTFGYSLAGGNDMDQNGYPDLVVGAYESSKALILWSRPVVDVTTTMHSVPLKLDPKTVQCDWNGEHNICFQLNVCFGFQAKPRDRFTDRIKLTYKLVAERFTGRKHSRVFFKGAKKPNNYEIERDIELYEQSRNKLVCSEHLVYILGSNQDFLNPIQFQLTYDLKDVPPPKLLPGQKMLDMNSYPILNEAVAEKILTVPFKKDCGLDSVCESNLVVRGDLVGLEKEGNVYILKVTEKGVLSVFVHIKNLGEDAHETALTVQMSEGLTFVKSDKDKKYPCIYPVNDNDVVCSIANPFSKKAVANFTLKLDPSKLVSTSRQLEIKLSVNTTSNEIDDSDNYDVIKANVVVETDLEVSGISDPKEMFYGGDVIGESGIKYEEQIGKPVNHSYEVKNIGNGTVQDVGVAIYWPYEVENGYPQGKHLLYLMEYLIDFPGTCDIDPKIINPLGYKRGGPPVVKNRTATSSSAPSRTRRDNVIPAETLRDPTSGRMIRVVTLDCQKKTAKCHKFKCNLGTVRPGQTVVIKIRARLWNSTFLEDYRDVDHVRILSMAEIVIDPKLNIKQTKLSNDRYKLMTTAYPDIEVVTPPGVPLWVIIVSVCAGLLLLIIIILLLWKCGFFKRQKVDEMRKHKGKLQKKKKSEYYEDEYN